jgi:hypothetical protein
MRTTYAALAFASTLLLTTSCTKEKLEDCPGQCTFLRGQLLTSGLQPLAGITVTAKWYTGGGFASGYATPRTKARTTTDASGNYQVRFYVHDDELQAGYFELTYEVDKDHYYAVDNTDSPDTGRAYYLKRDTTYQLSPFLIPRKAFVKLTVLNPNQIQEYFSVEFRSAAGHTLRATKQALGGGAVIGIPKQSGPFTSLVDLAGDQLVYVRATRSHNYVYTSTVDSLVVPAGTTRELTISY